MAEVKHEMDVQNEEVDITDLLQRVTLRDDASPCEFSKDGKLVGTCHYGPKVINLKKNETPIYYDINDQKVADLEAGCSIL